MLWAACESPQICHYDYISYVRQLTKQLLTLHDCDKLITCFPIQPFFLSFFLTHALHLTVYLLGMSEQLLATKNVFFGRMRIDNKTSCPSSCTRRRQFLSTVVHPLAHEEDNFCRLLSILLHTKKNLFVESSRVLFPCVSLYWRVHFPRSVLFWFI